MTRLSPSRRRACSALLQAERQGGFVREVFADKAAEPCDDPRDEAFALRLALGVIATKGCLDDALDRHLSRPRDVAPAVRMALRVAAFELIYLDAPSRVAVSQGVELVRSRARGAAGLANAVLRKVVDARESFLSAEDATPDQRELVARARRAGLPVWLARAIEASLGDRAADLLACALDPAPIALHANPLRAPGLESDLAAQACELKLPGAWRTGDVLPFVQRGSFDRADVVASDYTAQLIAAASTRPGSCLEVGSGRGTKTFVMAAEGVRADFDRTHTALDLYEWKGERNLERMRAAGLPEPRIACGDARDLASALGREGGSLFDTVLIDAPCSGTGTMRRHVEIPWRLAPADIKSELPALQLELLREASRVVSVGGELFYATCSVIAAENHAVVDAFLASAEGAGFELRPVSSAQIFGLPGFGSAAARLAANEDERGRLQTVPARDGFDGHFCARMVRLR